ncbi:hypothetical protein D9758_014659 [Tetrapyrgos nigripes]|uniref:Uncharacterized protein n=1 Tax=Tetrapyrgos nigripes TaxID=182062 RepID=A0A8H5CUC9_9AGAR|nr:hypothetical protein D9758_014659 [Tetrapyrgos nigripes]
MRRGEGGGQAGPYDQKGTSGLVISFWRPLAPNPQSLLNNKNRNMTQPSEKVFSKEHQWGGSCLTFVNGLFRVESESAGTGAELGPSFRFQF